MTPRPAAATPCAIAFDPIPTGECDATVDGPDAREDRIGVQATFALHTDCDRVTLVVDDQGHQVDHGGRTVEVTVDLYEGPNVIYATAAEPGTSRRGHTPEFVFDVDAVRPELRTAFPEDGAVLTADTPGVVADGEFFSVPLRFSVGGAVQTTIVVNDSEPVVAGSEGIVETTISVPSGTHSVAIAALDRCGNLAEKTVQFTLDHRRSALQITSPHAGSNLGVLDDVDPEMEGVQIDFIVVATGIEGEARIACRPVISGEFEHHSAPVPAQPRPFAVHITIPEGPFACRAEHVGFSTVSDEVEVAMSLAEVPDPPRFLSPRNGDEVQTDRVDIEVSAPVENGTLASLTVGESAPRFAVARAGTFLWTDVTLAPGANVVTVDIEDENSATIRATLHRTP